ncbi:MAG: hypothetical protein ACFFCX_11705 [Candidatus Sifarchaeia archaeon]
MQLRSILIQLFVALIIICSFQIRSFDRHWIQNVDSNDALVDTIIANYTQERGELILNDEFILPPLGFNSTLWSYSSFGNTTLTWSNGEKLVLNCEKFTQVTLESIPKTGPEVIAEFEFSFSLGKSYFGIGWVDAFIDPNDEWIANLRCCQNGVFIDYWDDNLFLVTYCDGKRVATEVSDVNASSQHRYCLVWGVSYVRLYIDGVQIASSSICIPNVNLPFMISLSGHHRFVETDRLVIDSVRILSRDATHYYSEPKIMLIWPKNHSSVYTFDKIDLEIVGDNSTAYYSWDDGIDISFQNPWDIEVPKNSGFHNLRVRAENVEGSSSIGYFGFDVIEEVQSLAIPNQMREPLIDGIITRDEINILTIEQTRLRNEDRSEMAIDVYFGYFNNSLYVGAATRLQDKLHSRISLYLDCQGNGVWGDSELGSNLMDICITTPTPRAEESYRGIRTHYGQIYPIGVVYDCSVTEEGVAAEFLIPVDSIGGNSTKGIGVGIVVIQGGYSSFYPASTSTGEMNTLLIVRNLGAISIDMTNSFFIIWVVSLFCIVIVSGYVSVRVKKPSTLIEDTIEDEHLDRIRTLLLSHPQITFERLALLAGSDTETVKRSVSKLVEDNLLSCAISISERGIERNIDH